MAKLKLKKKLTKVEDTPVQEVKEKTNLRDIVDRTKLFTMLYSGVEYEKKFEALYDMGIRNYLMSYHYVQKKHLDNERYTELGVKFFIDSGAFTYMQDLRYQDNTIEDWEKQIVRYLNWARRHKDILLAIASLDLEHMVGGKVVQGWNEKYFEPFMLETGIPVCFVWHENLSELSWEQYCQRYPYVGMPWETGDMDLSDGMDMLKVAEKHGTLVHGMAMTKTTLLTKLPFYTVDSTSWMMGLQYGEVNYWNGTKMTRLKKEVWKGSMLETILSYGLVDKEKLLNEEMAEMIRVNVHAFILAEEYIRDRLKAKMYWLRPDSVERKSIEEVSYPSPEWLEDKNLQEKDWQEYAKSFNVSLEDKETAIACVIDITCFLNWNVKEYQEFIESVYTPELIKTIHDDWINRVVEDDVERIEDLVRFYTECLMGTNDKLLVLGTNFDRIVKERESYITDDEYDTVDMTPLEVQNKLSKYLPMRKDGEEEPSIDELDEEIFKEEQIIPIRDAKGRFLKGQKAVLKPKQMYSKKFPKLACDTCHSAQKCAEYKSGHACAFNEMFKRYDTRDMGDIIQAMQGTLGYSLERMQRSMVYETMNGGLVDPNVTALISQNMSLLKDMQKVYESGSQEVLRQTKIIRSDGSEETRTQVTNPQEGSILAQIFGGSFDPQDSGVDEDEYIDLSEDEVSENTDQ